jgi:hypothetical protein
VTFPDFEEFIACLNAHRVRYLIVGGYAVGFHARPRATKDLDVLVDRSAANARRVQAALFDFLGSKPANITLAKLRNPRTLIVLGTAPVRIDVLTDVDGIRSFAAAWRRRARGVYGETAAEFVALDDLIASKDAAGRPQDLGDLDALRRVRGRMRGVVGAEAKRSGSNKRPSRRRR